jgi:hypothetical protein
MLAETWRAINKVDSTNMQAFIFACFPPNDRTAAYYGLNAFEPSLGG